MEYKSFFSKVVSMDGDERTVTGITAVMGVIDYGDDRIFKGAFNKTIHERAGQIKHLWQHDAANPPTAAIVELHEIGRTDLPADMKEKFPDAKGGLVIKRRYLDTPRGNEILAGLKSKPPAITEMSFGYDPVKFDYEEIDDENMSKRLVRNLREVRLWDTSDVNWGMNPATIASVKSIQFKDTGKAQIDAVFSPPVLGDFTDKEFDELSDAEKARIAEHYTWKQSEKPSDFSGLLLPHHAPAKSGVGPAVWSGVEACMKSLMTSTHGVPAGQFESVYRHLAKHYEQFGKEPPDSNIFQLLRSINDALIYLPNPQTGKGFDFDPVAVCEKLKQLDELLRAEPKSIKTLLTHEQLAIKIEICKRQLAQI